MNAKHQFKYTYNETDLEEFSPLEVTFEMPAEISLTQMLNNFEQYLRACGFFFDGKLEIVQDGYDVPEEEPEGGCVADWDKNCGLEETSSSLEKDDWDENAFHEGLNEIARKSDEKIKKSLKEWNEGIAKLENDLKAKRDIEQQAYERASRNAAVVKNNWVHGMCNPPSPDWKKQ